MAGRVRLGDTVADKPGRLVEENRPVRVLDDLHPYVGRGGVKLEHALRVFHLDPAGKTAVDIGASTGGFTDCLLKHGAKKVFAVDVGYGQLDWKLRNHPRVVCLDRQNARELKPEDLGEAVDLAVIDVSFISLRLVIPPVVRLLKPDGEVVALVKPQFEVGKEEVEHQGVIQDPKKHFRVLRTLRDFLPQEGWVLRAATPSPITGAKGNREFFLHAVPAGRGEPVGEETLQQMVTP